MPNNVYYSVCPYGTGDIKTGSPTIEISSGVATLSVTQTGNIGVGCRITFDTSEIVYISAVNSATSFDVVTALGATPSNTSSAETVNSIIHEYASSSDAEAGATDSDHINNTSLVTADVILNLPCYYDHDDNTADAVALVLSGITTGVNNPINIYTPQGGAESINNQRHEGWFDSTPPNCYRHEVTGSNITTHVLHLDISGLWLEGTDRNIYTYNCNGGVLTFHHNLMTSSMASNEGLVRFYENGGNAFTVKVYNNIIKATGAGAFGVYSYSTNVTAYVYNNTVISTHYGYYRFSGSVKLINNISYGSVQGAFIGTWASGSDYNATNRNSVGGTFPDATHNLVSQSFDFVDSANGDYHVGEDSDIIGLGFDLSSDINCPVTDDIDGDARDGSTPDIGYDEYKAAATGNPWYYYAQQ